MTLAWSQRCLTRTAMVGCVRRAGHACSPRAELGAIRAGFAVQRTMSSTSTSTSTSTNNGISAGRKSTIDRQRWTQVRHQSSQQTQRTTEGTEYSVEDEKVPLKVTRRAVIQLNNINARHLRVGTPPVALRVSVHSGGCHGYQTLINLVPHPADTQAGTSTSANNSSNSNNSKNDDDNQSENKGENPDLAPFNAEEDVLILAAPGTSGTAGTSGAKEIAQAAFIIDRISLGLVEGSTLDFVQELIGSTFQVVDNPHADSSCGCKVSFGIKF